MVCPAIEVQGSRYAGAAFEAATPLQKIADGGQNVRCIVGRGRNNSLLVRTSIFEFILIRFSLDCRCVFPPLDLIIHGIEGVSADACRRDLDSVNVAFAVNGKQLVKGCADWWSGRGC